jgi:spore maturation protein CgeB
MPTRFLKASSYYPAALRWFYARQSGVEHLGYAEQHAALMRARIAWNDAWARHLKSTSRFETMEVVVNAEPLQRQWAKEHGVRYSEDSWAADIFFAQCAEYQPEVVFAHSHDVLLNWWTDPRARPLEHAYVIGYDGTLKHLSEFVDRCDLMLTCVRRSVEFYENRGLKSLYFPYGFEAEILPELRPENYAGTDVSFVGSLDVRAGHGERLAKLSQLTRELPVRCWMSQMPPNGVGVARLFASLLRLGEWSKAAAFPLAAPGLLRLAERNLGELYGIEMFSALAASRITLNIHIDQAGTQAANMRLFEATGAGACLLTDWKENIGEFFEPDREIVTFRSVPEAVEKARYLLEHESARAEIARRGQARTLQDHATQSRIHDIANWLTDHALV